MIITSEKSRPKTKFKPVQEDYEFNEEEVVKVIRDRMNKLEPGCSASSKFGDAVAVGVSSVFQAMKNGHCNQESFEFGTAVAMTVLLGIEALM